MHPDMIENIEVVLAGPKDSKNVGSVCRAMKNMGLSRLAISGSITLAREEVKVLAVHAYDVYENASFYHSLSDALRNVSFSCGITRRSGRWRKYSPLTPSMLAEKIAGMKSGSVAIVFGNEERGLTDSELGLCHAACNIPSSPLFPSLNLSHAVILVAYEIFTALSSDVPKRHNPVSGCELDAVAEKIKRALSALGFFTQVTPEDMTGFFRDILSRAMIDNREAERLSAIFGKIEGIARKKLS